MLIYKKKVKLAIEIILIIFITLVLIKIADYYFGLSSRIFWIKGGKEEINYRQLDNILHHSLKPHSQGVLIRPEYSIKYKINGFGFRDNEFEVNKSTSVFRIVVVGDSFVEGYGVELEDTFIKVLEKKLNISKKRYEVINAGVASYSPL